MTNALKLIIAGVAVSALAASALSQGAGPKNGPPPVQGGQKQGKGALGQRAGKLGKMHHEILAKLDLNPAQKTKLADLEASHKKAIQDLMQAPGEKASKKEKFQSLNQKFREDMMGTLTPAQKTKYQTLMREAMEKARAERGEGKKKGPPPPGGTKPPKTPPPA